VVVQVVKVKITILVLAPETQVVLVELAQHGVATFGQELLEQPIKALLVAQDGQTEQLVELRAAVVALGKLELLEQVLVLAHAVTVATVSHLALLAAL
jgi:hypothetical protein